MAHYIYILECSDNTLYIGATSDLKKRVIEHNTSTRGAKYTRARRPVTLKYVETVRTFAKSRAREAALKRLTRTEKLRLIAAHAKTRRAPHSPL